MSAGGPDRGRPAEERLNEMRAALDEADARIRKAKREVRAAAVPAMRAFLFGEQFRTAVAQDRAREVDRGMWRKVFIDSPEAFDFAMSQDWGPPR